MKRRPNPWIVVPSLVAAAIAAWLGGTVIAVSCRYRDLDGTIVTCPGWTALVSFVSFVVVGIGMAVVLVLVFRSIVEWREHQERRSDAAEDQ